MRLWGKTRDQSKISAVSVVGSNLRLVFQSESLMDNEQLGPWLVFCCLMTYVSSKGVYQIFALANTHTYRLAVIGGSCSYITIGMLERALVILGERTQLRIRLFFIFLDSCSIRNCFTEQHRKLELVLNYLVMPSSNQPGGE